MLMLAGLFGYTNQGIGFAISNYNLTYVWQFSANELLIYSLSLFAGAVFIFLTIGPIAHRLGKKGAAAALILVGAALNMTPYVLRLLDAFPEPNTPALLPTFLALNTSGTALGIGAMILGASMMSDVVEASEERTGRREEDRRAPEGWTVIDGLGIGSTVGRQPVSSVVPAVTSAGTGAVADEPSSLACASPVDRAQETTCPNCCCPASPPPGSRRRG